MPDYPANWEKHKLTDVLDIQNGYAFDSEKFSDKSGMPLIRIRDLKVGTRTEAFFDGPYDPSYLVDAGDYLIGMDGNFGCFRWNGPSALLNQRVCRLRNFSDQVDPDFIFYGINEHLTEIEANTSYATVKHLSSKQIKAIEMAFPSLDEQRRVVARIKECMERIDEIEGLRSETKKMAATLELAAFHDALVAGINQHGWPMGTLGEVALSFRYGTSAKAHSDEIGTPVLRMGNIVNGYFDYSNLKYIELQERELDKYRLKMGDILINRTNSLELVGKAAMFDREDGEWAYASYLVCVDVDRSRVMPEFATAVINSRMGRDFVAATARRAIGMVNINAKEMARFPMPLPPLKDQEAIVELLRTVRSSAKNLRSDLEEPGVGHLRSAVLRKAFAGEL